MCTSVSSRAEDAFDALRVIAHDDTALMQSQKLLVRKRALDALQSGGGRDEIASALDSLHIPYALHVQSYSPGAPYPLQSTLVITLGKGQGRNWFGVLCRDFAQASFLWTQKKSGALTCAAQGDMQVVFPWLHGLIRFFTGLR
ncbi:MAG: hypothetical protein E7326_06245 [Clostridiales bacterium]|nr:hypothetical protein [Clostridiales bacterium]